MSNTWDSHRDCVAEEVVGILAEDGHREVEDNLTEDDHIGCSWVDCTGRILADRTEVDGRIGVVDGRNVVEEEVVDHKG